METKHNPLIILLTILLIISVGMNINNYTKESLRRQQYINRLYDAINISIIHIEAYFKNPDDLSSIVYAGKHLNEVYYIIEHHSVSIYSRTFNSAGDYLQSRHGMSEYDILSDGIVSEREEEYLQRLLAALRVTLTKLASEDKPFANRKLSYKQISSILLDFHMERL